MRSSARQANERARGQRLWRNGRNEPARQAARPPRPAAPPSTSRKAAAGGRRKLASSCEFELRLQPQLDTPSPLGRGSRHAPNESVCLLRLGTVVDFLLVLPVGTDWCRKLALSCGFSRSSSHRAPWGVAPATPRTNWCVCSVSSSPRPPRPQAPLSISSGGLSRSSTHRAPWGVAQATPRTRQLGLVAPPPSSSPPPS